MKMIIRQIRQYANLSQQEFADKLGVTFASINRWENGKAFPNPLAQDRLYEYCCEKKIPVYEMIIDRIRKEADTVTLEKGRMLLYHGSKSGIKGEIAPISRSKCDFGAGFYMGTDPMQPLTLICDFENARFYIVSIHLEELNRTEIGTDLDWAMMVAYHRGRMERIKGTDLYNKQASVSAGKDVLIGSIADDRMFTVLDNFFLGFITDQALVKSLSALQLGKQYVAISQKGCNAVRIEKEIPVSHFEKRILKDVSEENRIQGIRLADEICKNYRRDGMFYDEIIEQAKKG